jgi:DMSO reductase anchor subunit
MAPGRVHRLRPRIGGLPARCRPAEDATFTLVAISVALALGATAVLFSLAHLSKPRRAYRALRRFPVSALSREIAAYALYLLVTAIAWVVEVPGRAPAWLMILGVAAGAIAVVASAQVYLLPARPTWRHWSTIGAFLGCALSLGLSTALLLGEWTLDPPAEAAQTDTARWLALGGIAVTAIALAARVIYLRGATADTKAAWELVATHYSGLLWLRIFVGITLAAVALALSWSAHGWIFAAWPALLVGELLDRRLFFAGTVPLSFRAEIPGVR